MRHKNWKTYLKIACSWILIFSICFMNLETVSASEDTISVQSLNIAMQRSVANGDEQTTDRVEYVDVNGNSIAGAPSVIQFGAIADHKDLSIEGRHRQSSAKRRGDG